MPTFAKLNLKDQTEIVVLNAPASFEPELKARDDAEVPLAAANRPEQAGLGPLARLHDLAVGGDHLRRQQVVDRQPVLPYQESNPAGERDPAASHLHSAGHGTSTRAGLPVPARRCMFVLLTPM